MAKAFFSYAAVGICAGLLLTGCGGGGGGGSSSAAPAGGTPTYTAPTTNASVPVVATGASATTYTGEELAAYNWFSTNRQTCGFGLLQQNAQLDTAARNHIVWMVNNNTFSHYEVAATAGFTGVTPWDRMAAAGYSGVQFGEILAGISTSNKTGFGLKGARNLLVAPYHLMGAMQGNREIGVSVKSGGPIGSGADYTAAVTANESYLAVDMAASHALLPQVQRSTDVLTYPCQGVTGTAYALTAESPNPVPSRNLAVNPIGQPVFVQLLAGNVLVITSVSVTGPAGAVALLPTMTASNDPNQELLANMAIIMPSAPLSPSSAYSVFITGTNNGVGFSRSFGFSTGT